MTEPINLGERRAEITEDSKNWTPVECLRALLRDIESGVANPKQLCVHMLSLCDDHHYAYHYHAAGMSYQDHLALLEIAKLRLLQEWLIE